MKKRAWQTKRKGEVQEYLFLIYEGMGMNRTLRRLWGIVRSLGVEISLKSIERLSSEFNWQSRILERAARHESAGFQDFQDQVERMTEEHTKLFQNIGIVTSAGVQKYIEDIAARVQAGLPPTLDIDLGTIGKLAQTYQYGERLARGLATSKAEVIVEVLPPLVKDMFAVFLAVNVITNDPPDIVKKREAEFISRGDQVLLQYYGKTEKTIEGGREE